MKKLLLQTALSTIILLSGVSFLQAQSFKVIPPKLVVFSGVKAKVQQAANFHYKNTSGDSLQLQWFQSKVPAHGKWIYQMCDNKICYYGTGIPNVTGFAETNKTPNNDTAAMLGDWTPDTATVENDTFQYVIYNPKTTDRDTFTAVFMAVATGIENQAYGNIQFETSPNPVTTTLRISSKNLHAGMIEIFNLNGQKLQSTLVNASQYTNINTEALTPGMYLLRYSDTDGNFGIRKFVKE